MNNNKSRFELRTDDVFDAELDFIVEQEGGSRANVIKRLVNEHYLKLNQKDSTEEPLELQIDPEFANELKETAKEHNISEEELLKFSFDFFVKLSNKETVRSVIASKKRLEISKKLPQKIENPFQIFPDVEKLLKNFVDAFNVVLPAQIASIQQAYKESLSEIVKTLAPLEILLGQKEEKKLEKETKEGDK